MNAGALRKCLAELDAKDVWLISSASLRLFFLEESDRAFFAGLKRCSAGEYPIIRKLSRCLWYNPNARSMPRYPLLAAVPAMRPFDFNYLSLESVLSEAGVISQISTCMTVMTTGRDSDEIIKTPLGPLEFVHTERADVRDEPGIVLGSRGILEATPEIAYRDLKRVGRSLGLVDLDVLKEIQNERHEHD